MKARLIHDYELRSYPFQLDWPVTLHCDLGCDNYDAIPLGRDPANPLTGCEVPQKELRY